MKKGIQPVGAPRGTCPSKFNGIMLSDKDSLTAARRNDILMSPQDAARLALRNRDPITLRNELGEFHGHVRIDPITKQAADYRLQATGEPDNHLKLTKL